MTKESIFTGSPTAMVFVGCTNVTHTALPKPLPQKDAKTRRESPQMNLSVHRSSGTQSVWDNESSYFTSRFERVVIGSALSDPIFTPARV